MSEAMSQTNSPRESLANQLSNLDFHQEILDEVRKSGGDEVLYIKGDIVDEVTAELIKAFVADEVREGYVTDETQARLMARLYMKARLSA